MTLNQDDELSNERKTHQTLSRLFKWKKHRKVFVLWIILLICLLIIAGPLSLHISYALPTMKRRDISLDIFSEERARDYLNNLTQFGSRVSHTRGNFDAQNYLITQIKRIISNSKRHLRFEVDLQNLTDFDHRQLQNILVRVSNPTTKYKNVSSLLLSAHYDSVEFSPGACDDGSGVVILLELLSNLINDLTMTFSDVHLIVLLTNAEEIGLLGAQAFITNHPWRSNIHRFINVDAVSCNEKANLVRMKPSKLIIDYSRVSRPRANVIFKNILQWIGLRTDYDTYISNSSLLGYEFIFLADGYTYHTTLDILSNIKQGVLQDLGDNLALLVRHILLVGVEEIEDDIHADSLIYFDVFGRYLFVYKMSTSIIIQQILIILIIVISVTLIILDEIYHRKRSSSCSDRYCIYFHFKYSSILRIISIILYFISNLFSIMIGLLFSIIIALLMSITRPVSWFGNPTLATLLFSFPYLIGSITNAYLWDIFHRFILRKYPKNSVEIDPNHLNDIKFDFEQNISIVLVYGLLMIVSIYFKNQIFYPILIWSIFICPIYLLLMIIEFILHWKEIHWDFFKQRYHWLFFPLIISLLPLSHTIDIINQLIRFFIPLLSHTFSLGLWIFYKNMVMCSVIAIPTIFFSLIFLPILQRTKYFSRTLFVLLIPFSITLIVAYNRQPFTNIRPNIFYTEHTSRSFFKVEKLFDVPFNVPLQSQSSWITVTGYNDVNVSRVLDDFSAKSGYILRNKWCFLPTICVFDDTFNRTIAVQNIKIESVKNFTNYTILIRHALSYYIRVSSNSSIEFIVRNEWVVPRVETIIDVISNTTLFSFDININIRRCNLTDSPFLLLFTHLISNMVPIGKDRCQAINDNVTLIIERP